ncbi:MAG: GNAT family N-acetyltransferase [Gammaproteobacteria bacterium]|nr:GNAT family N-acetyltransferase [Gammaproteobacteria bacterium]
MTISIRKLTIADLNAVDELMKRHSRTLGFLPREALRNYLEKENTFGAKTNDGKLIGYLLQAAHPDYFRIAQLCVAEEFNRKGIARQLIDELKNSATTQKDIRLRCRNDFPAHEMWPRLGFTAIDEQPGRSKDRLLLTLWRLTLAPDDQLGLFQAKTSDESLDVVIDAQIFFDFDEADSDKSRPSKALLSDFLVDDLRILRTDELLNEIAREKDSEQRKKSRKKAHEFQRIEYDPKQAEHFAGILETLLPSNNPSQESDIKQLAQTAASEVKIFVTRDQKLLKKSEELADRISLQVVSPTELIIRLHELSEQQSYAPTRIFGFELRWQRISSEEVANFPYSVFLNQGERQGVFREKLGALLAKPDHHETECLQSKDRNVAIRALTRETNKALNVPMLRMAQSIDDPQLFRRFAIADTIANAVEDNLDVVKIDPSTITPGLEADLLEMGFVKCNDNFVRFCFSRSLTRTEVLSEIQELFPALALRYQNMPDQELQRHCSPLDLKEAEQNHFLIPIRSGYAKSLFDRRQAAIDMFVQNPGVLLRWDNVYYRAKSNQHMLRAPARILWYESGTEAGQIVAVSCLDAVEIDTAKNLFRKFKKFGVLEWRDVFDICEGDPFKEIMVLKFSHTFLFRGPVSLNMMRTVSAKYGAADLVPQSPRKLSTEIFLELFQLGYPEAA